MTRSVDRLWTPALRLAVGALVAREASVTVEDLARVMEAEWPAPEGSVDREIVALALRASRLVLIDEGGRLSPGPEFAAVARRDRDAMGTEFMQAAREAGL